MPQGRRQLIQFALEIFPIHFLSSPLFLLFFSRVFFFWWAFTSYMYSLYFSEKNV